jgi:ABC-2 type transport system ATP-binding protein
MSALATLYAIQTIGLTKRFGRTLALDQLSLTVEAGEVFAFLGPNGAGKSTTIRLLLGHLQPTAGQAWIFGDASGDATAAHRHLAYVPADVALWPALSGAETLELLVYIGPDIDRRYRDELMQRFELEVDRRCGTYSTGNRQKVVLVAAVATEAPLLIFDEPTAGLDPVMEQQFRQCIAAPVVRGQTVFLSSHHLADLERLSGVPLPERLAFRCCSPAWESRARCCCTYRYFRCAGKSGRQCRSATAERSPRWQG